MSTSPDADRVAARLRAHDIGISTLGRPNALARQFDFANDSYEWRRLFSELFGTFLLAFVAVGGPMANARFGNHGISQAALVVAPGLMVIATLVLVGLVGTHGTAGLTLPGPGVSTAIAMAWEAILTLGLLSVVLGTASGAQQIGAMAALGVGSYIALAGLIGVKMSGASMNPARSLGPALVLGDWASWWAYLAGPLIGAAVAVGIAHILRGRGGGETSRRAAQGTLGTSWIPGGSD